jgi:hypothetical protein
MFQLGQEVQYKDHKGIVDFVDEHYIGICINLEDIRVRHVRMIIYRSDWEDIIINIDRT